MYYYVLFVYALQIMAMATTGIEQCSVGLFIQLNYLQLHSSTHILQGWVQMSAVLGMTFKMTTFCHLKGIAEVLFTRHR